MGNPWVFLAVPVPLLVETHTCAKGMGIFVGQIIIPMGTQQIGGQVQRITKIAKTIINL